MKKLLSLLLTAVMLCSMLAVFTVPAFADEAKSWTENGEYYHIVNNGEELEQLMENCDAGDAPMHILIDDTAIYVDSIRISRTNHFIFEQYGHNGHCSIFSKNDNAPLFVIEESAPNTILDFSNHNMYLHSKNNDGNGGGIYVDASGFTVIGVELQNCYVSGDGGGIYVDATDCTIKDIRFFACSAYDGSAVYCNKESCKISGISFECCDSSHDGGAVYFDDSLSSISDSKFSVCKAAVDGGAICVNGHDVTIENCEFNECSAGGDGGAIYTCYGNYIININSCSFFSCSCGDEGPAVDGYGESNTTVYSCKSDKEGCFENCKCVQCTVVTEPEQPTEYKRPDMTVYARNAMQNNKNCDVIRPDIKNVTESENKLFTIEGKNAYGGLWEVDWQNALTIKAEDGYTITRIEAVVTNNTNYDALSIDNGTKADRLIDNPNYYGDPIAKDYIASFEDINAKSVTFTTKGSIYNWGTVPFEDFIIYYTKDSTLGSVFSGGTLWIIIGVAAVAAITAVAIVVVKKKSIATNGAANEKSDENNE